MRLFQRAFPFSLIALSAFVLFSCAKVEGPGGSSTIKGTIHVKVYDVGGTVINEYDAPDEDVYLIYGDEGTFYDDDVKTSYDGSFEFKYLQKGTYQVFVYQDCNSCPSGKEAVIKTVEITDNKSTVDVGVIDIID